MKLHITDRDFVLIYFICLEEFPGVLVTGSLHQALENRMKRLDCVDCLE